MNKAGRVFLILVFMFGLFSAISQIILVREFLAVFYGNELCLGVIFFSWFTWISVGAYFSKKILPKIKRTEIAFLSLMLLALLALPLEIAVIRNLKLISGIGSFQLFPFYLMVVSIFIIAAPVCIVIGFLFPCAVKLRKDYNENPISGIYMWESTGSMCGGILFSFFLATSGGHFLSISIVALTLILFLFIFLRKFPAKCYVKISLTLLFLFFSIIAIFSTDIERYLASRRWKGFAGGLELVESVDSRYQNISIGLKDRQYSVFENGQISISFPDPYLAAEMVHPALLQHKKPENVLVIGVPTNELVEEILKHPVRELHFVHLDERITRLVSKYHDFPENDRVKVFHADGRFFVKNRKEKYDIIISDLSDPSTALLNRFYTREFFREVKNILRDGGVFITGLTSGVNYLSEDLANYNGSVYFTLKSVFRNCLVSYGENAGFYASDGDFISLDANVLRDRYLKRKIVSGYFDPYYFETVLEKSKIEWRREKLESRPRTSLNTDSRPITYYYNLVLWSRFIGFSYMGVFKSFPIPLGLAAVLLACVILMIVKRPSGRTCLAMTMIVTGFSGMFLEIILLYQFQNIRGYLYSGIGLFVGVFMAGLFSGAAFSKRIGKININVLISVQFILILVSSVTWGLTSLLSGISVTLIYLVFIMIFIVTGFAVGFIFPYTGQLYKKTGMTMMDASSKLDAYDHLGAAIGALAGGTVLIPIAGIGFSCGFIIAVNLFAIISLYLSSS